MPEKIIFQPVRGTQARIDAFPIREGYVYYAYDSGRIYLDKDGTRYLMSNRAAGGGGGGTGIIYANGSNTQIIPVDLSEREPVQFRMELAAIENQILPEIDNLILNSDGRFFRVLGTDPDDETKILVKLLAVSGSGSGGGSGGGTVERDINVTWDNTTIAPGYIFIYGQENNAVFYPSTTVENSPCYLTFNIINNDNGNVTSFTTNELVSGEAYNFDTSQLPESSNITLQITVTSDGSQYNYGMGYQRNITSLRVIKMELEKPIVDAYQPLVKADDRQGTLNLKYRPIGDSSLSFTLHTYVDNEELGIGSAILESYLNQIVSVSIPRQSHGVHSIKLQMTTEVNGKTVSSNIIEYEGAWATVGETIPIIWVGKYDQKIINYENSYIYYMVYDPVNAKNDMPAEVHLFKDGLEISQVDGKYNDDNWLVWDISNLYTVTPNQEETTNIFSITCGGTRVNIPIVVTTKGSRELGLVAPESLILNMSTAGRSNTEIKRNRDKFNSTVNTDAINVTLQDFNWQNNGWAITDGIDKYGVDSGSYLSIANGSALKIEMAGNGLILNGAKDYTFELRFRVKNVQEYSTLVKVIPKYFYDIPDPDNPGEWIPQYTVTQNGEEEEVTGQSLFESEIEELGYRIGLDQYGNLRMDEANSIKTTETEHGVVCRWLNSNGYGFCVGTQEAYFRTPSGVANVRYCEDEVINLTMVASKSDNLCYVYLNSILAGAVAMPKGTGSGFIINSPFVFNSKYCDFDLYRFRIYELGLTMPQVIHNYLSDMHSIALYDQNQITNPLDPTALSYDLLVKYNKDHPDTPTMPYAVWQITDGTDELLSYKKGNNRAATVEFVNPPLDNALANEEITPWYYYTHCPSFYAEKVDLNVQGTSSQKYPRRNYKLKYKSAKDTWVYTQGPLTGCPLTKDYYFNISTGQLVTKESTNEETGEIEIVPIDKADYNSATMVKLAKKYHMDTEDFGTNKFTWKIDYMESSETYNTGFANLMGNLVHPLYTKHPLDDLNLGIDTSDMRTTVYGFPVLTFHKYTKVGVRPEYEYIGKYNMNLDKSSNEYYGFEDEHEQPYVPRRTKKVLNKTTNEYEDVEYQPTIAEIAECWELKDNQGNWCSFKYPDATSRRTGFMTLKEGTSGNSAQLELLNHYEYRYSYYGDQLDAAYEYTAFTDPDTQIKYTNNAQINQYLYDKHKNFEAVFNWLDSTNPDTATNESFANPIIYHTATYVTDDDSVDYEIILNTATQLEPNTEYKEYEIDNKGNQIKIDYYIKKNDNYWNYTYDVNTWDADVAAGNVYTGLFSGLYKATFTKDTREYRRQKFYAELEEHFDKEYCLTYYVLTELLLCYDSRGKNCMMATFGPHRAGGEYIWYPIFYDIDTQLGLNNSGAYLWDYDADVTKDNLFSTPTSVLWNNLYDLYYDDIVQKYRVLRGISNPSSEDTAINGSLTYENIAGAYECNPDVFQSYAMRGVRPIVAVGLDEYYKYLAPALTAADFAAGKLYAGYYDTTGNHKYQQNGPTYVYACQGDKKLTTELLLRNRLNYIDSWWMGGDYRAGVVENQIFIRANANQSTTSDLFLDSASLSELPSGAGNKGFSLAEYPKPYFDARPGAFIKPFLHQYVSYFADSQPSIPVKYDGSEGQEDGVWTNVDAAKLQTYKETVDLSQQIVYIPGGDYISSLGDISLMYPNSLQIIHGQRMLDFKLGSDIPGYKNPLINSSSDWELDTMPLLKSVNISKLSNFDRELDLTGSKKLQEFRALGSIIERVNFAPGAPLRIVHLPATMTTVSLVQNQNLKNIITSVPQVVTASGDEYIYNDPSTYKGLYLEGVTDYVISSANAGHKINNLEIAGGSLGYGSYIILKNLYDLKKEATKNNTLSVGLTDVEWTPYVAVEKGTPYESTETYFFLNDHSKYDPYTYVDESTWVDQLNNSLVYVWNSEYTHGEEHTITNLDLFDALIDQYELAKRNDATSQFSNLVETTEATIPTITGHLYVYNDSEHKIKETDLTEKYANYFPQLQITAKEVQESNVTKYVRVFEETGIVETIESLRSDNIHPLRPTKNVPSKAGYDFIGWSTDVAGQNIFLPYHIDFNTGTGSYDDAESYLSQFTFSENNSVITLYAQFTIHQNVITIYSGNEKVGAAIVPTGSTFTNPTYIYDIVNDLIDDTTGHNYLPYKDDSALAFDETYKFIGYSGNQDATWHYDSNHNPVIDELPPVIVETDIAIYSIFDIVNVHENVLRDNRYYNVIDVSLNDTTYKSLQLLHVKELKGKITLPRVVDGIVIQCFNQISPVSGVTASSVASNITHIFWENGSELQFVGSNACSWWPELRYFELPNYNMTIIDNALNHTPKFFAGIDDVDVQVWCSRISTLSRGALIDLGSNCLNNADYNSNQHLRDKVLTFSNIITIGPMALQGIVCSGFVFGSQTNSSLNYHTWGTQILNNTCYQGAGRIKNRIPLPLVRYYDHSDGNKDEIKNDLYYNHFYPNDNTETITTFDVLQPPAFEP